jgi:hypothetical protein
MLSSNGDLQKRNKRRSCNSFLLVSNYSNVRTVPKSLRRQIMLWFEILRGLSPQPFNACMETPVGTEVTAGHSSGPSADLIPNAVARRL